MDKYSHVFEKFIDFENLYDGYIMARKNKRYKEEVLSYTANLEENLITTQNELIWKTYHVDGMTEFIEKYPKKRIITAMPFKNRVVNCAAYNVLYPIYSKMFYEHSYGSIPGRGPIKAAERLQYWIRLVQSKPGKWYICKMDIAKFFFRIPISVQLRCLGEPIDDPNMMWFLETAIRCDGRSFGLPVDAKDVTKCERIPDIGMQVGSLISQLTANVVLNQADQYIKRELRVPYYLRYMDDMIFIAEDKERVQRVLLDMESFLYDNLGLELNSKTAIMPIWKPVEFVGKIVTADAIKMRNSSALSMKRHLKWVAKQYRRGTVSQDYALSVIKSYLGHMSHISCTSLRNKICKDFVLKRTEYNGG